MKLTLAGLIILYVAYGAVMILLHPRMIYPFSPEDRVLDGFRRVELSDENGQPVYLQELRGDGPVLLYFMGNGGSLSLFDPAFDVHRAAGRHILALEYRGGAGRPGDPSEARLKSDALLAADFALKLDRPVVVEGFSLGSGLATHVGANRPVAGIILVAPYDRLCRLMASRSWLPACLLPFVQKWHSIEDGKRIDAPLLVLHGTEDGLIPPKRSEAFATLATARRVLVEGADHTNTSTLPMARKAIDRFINDAIGD